MKEFIFLYRELLFHPIKYIKSKTIEAELYSKLTTVVYGLYILMFTLVANLPWLDGEKYKIFLKLGVAFTILNAWYYIDLASIWLLFKYGFKIDEVKFEEIKPSILPAHHMIQIIFLIAISVGYFSKGLMIFLIMIAIIIRILVYWNMLQYKFKLSVKESLKVELAQIYMYVLPVIIIIIFISMNSFELVDLLYK